MALIYSLKIEDHINISKINHLLATVSDFSEEDGVVKATDLIVNVSESKGLSIQIIEDDFGFTPKINISFRLNKFAEPDALYKQLMQAIWPVLKITKGDAVVLFNGENIILHRKKGMLYLNEIDNFWYAGTLPTDQQYEFKTMASL